MYIDDNNHSHANMNSENIKETMIRQDLYERGNCVFAVIISHFSARLYTLSTSNMQTHSLDLLTDGWNEMRPALPRLHAPLSCSLAAIFCSSASIAARLPSGLPFQTIKKFKISMCIVQTSRRRV